MRMEWLAGIQRMFEAGESRGSSLHSVWPVAAEGAPASPDRYKFSAESLVERETAVKQTLRTIDFAERLNAPFVVLHLGEVNMSPITERLIAMAKAGRYLSREY